MSREPVSVPREIFRAYDIRGQAMGDDATLTAELAYWIGRAYAAYIRPAQRVVVGGDQRLTTPTLKESAIDGIIDGGSDVLDISRAPSPLVYWATAIQHQTQPTGGLVITASHNPPQDNGIKLLEPGGMPLTPESIQQIADCIESGIDNSGRRGAQDSWNPKPDYWRNLTSTHMLERPLRISIDPGNGVASVTAAAALRKIGADVSAINDDPDEPNPPHPADPQHADNVEELSEFVLATRADLGFAFDGDGDRLGLIDGRGRRATPDQVLALLAQDWLSTHPAAQIQIDVKTSQAVIDHINALGGRPVFGPVGHSLGKYAMQERGIDFGGEASTHYYYRIDQPPQITDDAVRTACRIAELASRTSLEPLIDAIPRYRLSPEVKISCPDLRKHAISEAIARRARERWPVNEIDGARIDLSVEAAGGWCIVRASNTTPYLTVVAEARTDAGYEAVRRVTADILAEQGLDPTPLINQPPLD